MHAVMNLLIVYGLLRYFKWNLCVGSLPNPTGALPVFHHSILCAKSVIQAQSGKESTWYALHNSLSNVTFPWAMHMPCINNHHAGHYQLEMVFVHACLPRLQWVAHCMDLTAFSCFCSKIGLFSNTCTVISTWQNFHVKIFSWTPIKVYLHKHLAHEYFHTQKFLDLQ